jgi:hypothetical protein
MTNIKRYPINIWDDYYEEGDIPEGEIQETYIYVEDTHITEEKRKECLEKLLNHMNTKLKLKGVEMEMFYNDTSLKYPKLVGTENEYMLFKRWEITVKHLTHKRREKLVDELNDANLELDGIPFRIYSES